MRGQTGTFFVTMTAGASALLTHLGVMPASVSCALATIAAGLLIDTVGGSRWPRIVANLPGRVRGKSRALEGQI